MLKHLKMKNYKGFLEIEFNNFNKINIFVGDNNIGKTTILEAIDLISDPFNYEKISSNLNKKNKEQNPYYSIKNLFNKKNDSNKIELNFNYSEEQSIVISKIEKEKIVLLEDEKNIEKMGREIIQKMFKEKGNLKDLIVHGEMNEKQLEEKFYKSFMEKFNTGQKKIKIKELKYSTSLIEKNNKNTIVIKEGEKNIVNNNKTIKNFDSKLITPIDRLQYINSKLIIDKLINDNHDHKLNLLEAMKIFNKDIIDINYSLGEMDYKIAIKNEEHSYSVGVGTFGDGFKTLLVLLSYIYKMKNGVLLIDEIENGLYKSKIKDIYKVLIKTISKTNVQIFATTHSLEAIEALVEGAEEHLNDISIFKISDFKGKYYIDEYRGKKVEEFLEMGGDFR